LLIKGVGHTRDHGERDGGEKRTLGGKRRNTRGEEAEELRLSREFGSEIALRIQVHVEPATGSERLRVRQRDSVLEKEPERSGKDRLANGERESFSPAQLVGYRRAGRPVGQPGIFEGALVGVVGEDERAAGAVEGECVLVTLREVFFENRVRRPGIPD
jgi:hypothetical protein